jgi:hypothetical protein
VNIAGAGTNCVRGKRFSALLFACPHNMDNAFSHHAFSWIVRTQHKESDTYAHPGRLPFR